MVGSTHGKIVGENEKNHSQIFNEMPASEFRICTYVLGYDRTDGRTNYSLGMASRLYMRYLSFERLSSQEQMDDNEKFNKCHCIGRSDSLI